MRDYAEKPERMTFAANPECSAGPTAEQFENYVGMQVQLCQGSRLWPRDVQFTNGAAVYEFAKRVGMIDDTREVFYAIYGDTKHRPLGYRLISAGAITETIVSPQVIFGPAMVLAASEIFFVHNHPSGAVAPSPADKALTQRLVRVANLMGLRVMDNVVVGTEGFLSFVDEGIMPPSAI